MDRASGSGVFARDPDVLLDLIELELTEDLLKQEENKAVCAVCERWLEKHVKGWDSEVSQDDRCSEKALLPASQRLLGQSLYVDMLPEIVNARQFVQLRTAWRIYGTLREFPKFPAVNLWFEYPTHRVDTVGVLKDVEAEGEKPPWKKAMDKRKPKEKKQKDRKTALETAYESCTFDGDVSIQSLAEYMGIAERTVRARIKEHSSFEVKENIVTRLPI